MMGIRPITRCRRGHMSHKTLRNVALLAAGLGLGIAGANYAARESRRISSGARPDGSRPALRFARNAPLVADFSSIALDGRLLTSADWRGKVTIVNFWATWCPPCRTEIPEFIALQEKYRHSLQIIGVSLDEGSPDVVRAFATEHGINYPIVMMTDDFRRGFPGVFALPTSFVLDPRGRIVQRHVGLISISVYEQEVRALAGLDADAVIEEVDNAGPTVLGNAAQATEIPGLEMSKLTPDARRTALERLNADHCTCGCGLTLAELSNQ